MKLHCLQPSITSGPAACIVDETDQPKDLRDFRSTTTLNLSKQQSAGPVSTSLFPCDGWINQSNSSDRDAERGLVGSHGHFFQTTKTSLQIVSRKFKLLPLLYPSTHSPSLSFGSSFHRTWIPIITSYSTPSKHTQALPLNIFKIFTMKFTNIFALAIMAFSAVGFGECATIHLVPSFANSMIATAIYNGPNDVVARGNEEVVAALKGEHPSWHLFVISYTD